MLRKVAELLTPLQAHQQRAIDKLKASNGLLVVHGLGSGKTLTSIGAADQLGLPMEAVVPAPLVPNYEKELKKHLGGVPADARIRSYDRAKKDQDVRQDGLVVLDEAHKMRNVGTAVETEVARRARTARARMLLSASPVYNQPTDIAPLLNTAAGKNVVPSDPALFKSMFVGEKRLDPSLLNRIRGIEGALVPALKNRERLVRAATGYVDVHKGGGKDFPRRIDEDVNVTMSPEQWEMYQFHEGKMPWHIKAKVRDGLPLSKAESKDLNAFSGALRQTSNTIRPYKTDMDDASEEAASPKLRRIVEDLIKDRAGNPNHRGVIYSNYLEGGLLPLARMLQQRNVPHGLFHGGVSKNERERLVRDYNEGRLPTLLLSGSGSEGLDLKGTRGIQIAEPHWNNERINQVIGRGIRFKSHEHLPEQDREVRVRKYYSEPPNALLARVLDAAKVQKRNRGIERYMQQSSDQKSELAAQIMEALQEASDKGPLRKTGGATPEDLLRLVPGSRLSDEGKPRLLYSHPAGPTVEAHYDPEFLGTRDLAGSTLQDDLDNAGYGALTKLDKANRQNAEAVRAFGGAVGGLGGALGWHFGLGPVVRGALREGVLSKSPGLSAVLGAGASLAGPTLMSWLGKELGSALAGRAVKEKTPEEVRVRLKHPDLLAPKPIKLHADVRLDP